MHAMRTIAHSTRKGLDNTSIRHFPIVDPDNVMINREALNHTWEPLIFLEDVFRHHPQF